MYLSAEDIDYIESRARDQIGDTGLPWRGIGPDEVLFLIGQVRRLSAALKQVDEVCEGACLGDHVTGRVQEIVRDALAAVPR